MATVRSAESFGLGIANTAEAVGFNLGWQRLQWMEVADEDVELRLEFQSWPNDQLLQSRVGRHFPGSTLPASAGTEEN